MRKTWKTCLTCGIWLCVAGGAIAQPHLPIRRNVNAATVVISPEGLAKSAEIDRLDAAAQAAMEAGDYAEAEASARQSVVLGDFAGLGHDYLAAALYWQGKTPEALAAYKYVMQHTTNGTDWPVYALLLLQTGQWAQAATIYNTPHYGEEDNKMLYGNNHFSPTVPEPQKLEACLHIALGLDTGWAGYCTDIRRPLQTLTEFQKALALEPNSAVTNYYYGYGLQQAGRAKDAQAAFAKAAAMGDASVKAAAEKAMQGN